MGIVELIAIITNFIPVWNVVSDVIGMTGGSGVDVAENLVAATDPVWWAFGLKVYTSSLFLQFILPYLEKLSRLTATKWDDNTLTKVGNLLSYVVEITSALGAVDPGFLNRLQEVRLPKKEDVILG